MLTPDNIRQLLAQGEHLHLECKRCKVRLPNSLWETYSAFANSYGGTILLGIEEHSDKQNSPVPASMAALQSGNGQTAY